MAGTDSKNRKRIEYIVIGVFALVALALGINRFKETGSDDEVFSRKQFNEQWKEVEILEANLPEEEKAIDYTVTDDRAPFKGPFDEENKEEVVDENIALPTMVFQGMVWKGARPQAIIDNKVYDVNDIIEIGEGSLKEEVKVKAISQDGIHLVYKGKEFIVRPK